MKKLKEIRLTVRLTEDDKAILDELTAITDRTSSNLVRKLIKDYYNTIQLVK